MENEQIELIRLESAGYPARLRQIPDPPKKLYVLGKLPDEQSPSVALVGARDCSEYGRYLAQTLGRRLGEAGVQVISGMARGIDGIGQLAALDAGGSSYGVLGCGADICYPRQNRELYERLCREGGVLSELAPGTPPLARNFPPRNRIVSGLADAVIVVEARAKSGTLITVDMALEQGREVYVTPGRVTDALSVGCNRLMKTGAGILLDIDEFLEELWEIFGRGRYDRREEARAGKIAEGERRQKKGEKGRGEGERKKQKAAAMLPTLTPEEIAVYQALDFYPLSLEEIAGRLSEKCRGRILSTCLMQLCAEGLASQVSPGYFCLAADGAERW